ncbi:response regulator [Horticoccus luteus]|uniref:Response regulator n=1 Tax=Horticoccus luteus TaxID=2862869 RepID=A0A8F9XHV1_9BACT|nr:response regulator [Horticoccus luteus]QYM80647.1 response regulator [Horticoccus luteus]
MKAKVLIVDDSSLARRTMRLLLEEMGHTVTEASDGVQALERYSLEAPDLVVLDMVMSGMYGLEVLAKIRELNPTARVIVATADIQRSTADEVHAAGATALINKPINRQELTRVIGSALNGSTP